MTSHPHAHHKTHHTSKEPQKKESSSRAWILISTFSFGLSLLWAGYLGWQSFTLSNELADKQERLATKERSIEELRLKNEELFEAEKAQVYIQKAEDYRQEWSQMVGKIYRMEDAKTRFLNFAIAPDKKIVVYGQVPTMEDVALLLEKIKSHPDFENPFITNTQKGDTGVFFNLQLNFTAS